MQKLPAKRRIIKVDLGNGVKTFYVPLPPLQLYLSPSQYHIGCFGLFCGIPGVDTMFLPPLGNIGNDFEVCMDNYPTEQDDLAEFFFSSPFNVEIDVGWNILTAIMGETPYCVGVNRNPFALVKAFQKWEQLKKFPTDMLFESVSILDKHLFKSYKHLYLNSVYNLNKISLYDEYQNNRISKVWYFFPDEQVIRMGIIGTDISIDTYQISGYDYDIGNWSLGMPFVFQTELAAKIGLNFWRKDADEYIQAVMERNTTPIREKVKSN